jgi:hypothetical protein
VIVTVTVTVTFSMFTHSAFSRNAGKVIQALGSARSAYDDALEYFNSARLGSFKLFYAFYA